MTRPGSTFGFVAGGLIILLTALAVSRAPISGASATPVVSTQNLFGKPLMALNREADSIEVLVPSVHHLQHYFNQIHYGWGQESMSVPRVALMAFPSDMAKVREVKKKKRLFFQSMLPLVLMETEHIRADRKRMLALFGTLDRDGTLTESDQAWLDDLARRYKISGDPVAARTELDHRVNTVPVSLALAMAANESGWGTSRFTEEGNNLFGQWTFTPGTGLVPKERPDGARYEVAVFPDLANSVRAYLKNLNTHWAYEEFRRVRATLPSLAHPDAGLTLARSLTRYSERGADYTRDLVRLIRANRLSHTESATLESGVPHSRVTQTEADAIRFS